MAHTYEELSKKTVEQLREIAKESAHDAVQGYSQMNKEHLLPALCKALNIDTRGHHTVVGIDKAGIKARLHALRAERDKSLAAHDHAQLKQVRRQMHRLKRRIRAATV
jgi:DNA-binding IclR family transcriptional regulator